jgi:hypothetical protein
MGGLGAAATVVIGIWVVIAFLLLPAAGSLRYWTAAFVILIVVVGAGDYLPARAVLAAVLGLHILFVIPAGLIAEGHRRLWTAPVSLVALTWLVVTGGRQYWLPALVTAAAVGVLGAPALWIWQRRMRSRPGVEVWMWPRREPAPPPPPAAAPAVSAEKPADEAPPEEPRSARPPRDRQPRNTRSFPPANPGRTPAQRPPAAPRKSRRPGSH